MSNSPARTRRSANAAASPRASSPSPPHVKKSPVPAQNENVLTRRKHATDAQSQSSAAANVSEAPYVQSILGLVQRAVSVLARFLALFLAVASVVSLILGMLWLCLCLFFNGNLSDIRFNGKVVVFCVCCILIGSIIGLVSGIYFKGGGGFRRSIFVFVFVIFIISDIAIASLMNQVWSGDCFSFEKTFFFTEVFKDQDSDWRCREFRVLFSILSILSSIPGIIAAFYFRDFVVGK